MCGTNLDIYKGEYAKIAYVYSKTGQKSLADSLLLIYKNYADNDESMYKHLSLAMYYSYKNEQQKAIEHLEHYGGQNDFHYWPVQFLDDDH